MIYICIEWIYNLFSVFRFVLYFIVWNVFCFFGLLMILIVYMLGMLDYVNKKYGFIMLIILYW